MLTVGATVVVAVVALQLGGTEDEPLPAADERNGRVFIQDNLWTVEDAQYATWVDGEGTPYVAKRYAGEDEWEVVDLGDLPGNPLDAPTVDDPHHVHVLGVDAEGHIHVMGNMHRDPLRYVRSTRPGDITEWEAGEVAGDAHHVTYPKFVRLVDGTLLFFRREGTPGDSAILLDALAPGAEDWEHVGTVLDGRPSDEIPYIHRVAVDPSSGAIHLAFMWRGRPFPEPDTNNDVGYARSDDGGRIWRTSDGREQPLPITHEDAETVLDTAPRDSGLLNNGGMAVDTDGRPHVLVRVDRPTGNRYILHLWFDGVEWQRDELDGSTVDGRPTAVATPDGSVWLVGARGTELRVQEITPGGADHSESFGRVPVGWEASYDAQALEMEGSIEVLVPDGDEPRVLVADPG
jgi:hypothetical protein